MIKPDELERCVQDPDIAISNITLLFTALGGDDESCQDLANTALEGCGPPPVTSLPTLEEQIRDGNSTQIYWACTLVGRWFGASASTPGLSRSIQGSLCQVFSREVDLAAKERAAWALGQSNSLEPQTREILESQLKVASPRLQRLIETALQSSAV